MPPELTHLFARLCGQNPEHTWAPGGLPLPCCQRCTGLYAGAAIAAIALLWFRPRLDKRFLEIHGLCLLVMAPLGLHWVSEGPVLRSISGVLFAFGVAAFLWLPFAAKRGWADVPNRFATPGYALVFVTTLWLVPTLASHGGRGAAWVLIVMAGSGVAALFALVLAALSSIALARR